MQKFDIQIKNTPLSSAETEQFVTDETCGGIVSFVGTARKYTQGKVVLRLEFEAYEAMALKEMRKIAEQVLEKFGAKKVAIHHRTGIVGLKEIAVVISVSCAHRKAAFEACAFAIDTLKETVPIWKKEVFENGDVWVAAHP